MKPINKISKNPTEKAIQDWFLRNGYDSLKSGWPDFVFWKKNLDKNKMDFVFVEVKQDVNTLPKNLPHRAHRIKSQRLRFNQRRMKNIFNQLGLNHKVAFGLKEDGSPNFK